MTSNSVDGGKAFQTQMSTHSEPSGNVTDIMGPDNARFDSTNMFHWCSAQPLSACLLVGVQCTVGLLIVKDGVASVHTTVSVCVCVCVRVLTQFNVQCRPDSVSVLLGVSVYGCIVFNKLKLPCPEKVIFLDMNLLLRTWKLRTIKDHYFVFNLSLIPRDLDATEAK